ncbi:ORF6N domain-containing protein [Candidatus Sumerlaeota bacterium]|nr:ORF6N domain-containing protein [Candidatus Sumerlaeota bacterium]
MKQIVKTEDIAPMIHWIRQEKVMLDRDLADLYGVETRTLKQAVRRNLDRFPEDFMFKLEDSEVEALVSQNVIPSKGIFGGAVPMAFTEQGVAMLSSVLRSKRATEVNIAIMRTFVQLRRLMDSNRELAKKINQLEKKYDEQFSLVFQAIKQLLAEDEARKQKPKRRIGFNQE